MWVGVVPPGRSSPLADQTRITLAPQMHLLKVMPTPRQALLFKLSSLTCTRVDVNKLHPPTIPQH
jgi:hypothetical protein